MNKELEEAIKNITICKSLPIMYGSCIVNEKDLKILLKALDNSISKEVIEKKKNQMLEEYKKLIETNSTKAFIMKCQIEFAEELLKGGENK